MNKIALTLVLLASLFSLPAAAQEMSAPDALEAMHAGKLTLIDIRTPAEWKETGVAQGAKRVNMIQPDGANGFIKALEAAVGPDKTVPIGLICRTGNRTTQVHRFLKAQGYTQVYNVREGMAGSNAGPGWLARKLPLESCSAC